MGRKLVGSVGLAPGTDEGTDLTTKGDVHGYSTTNTRIPIGSNDQVLTADSSEALGLKWATGGGATVTNQRDSISSNDTTTSSTFTDSSLSLTCENDSGSFLLVANIDWIVSAADTSRMRYLDGTTEIAPIQGSPTIKGPVPLVMAGTSDEQVIKVQYKNADNSTTVTLLGSANDESAIVMQEIK
jgi:hypothetical protein